MYVCISIYKWYIGITRNTFLPNILWIIRWMIWKQLSKSVKTNKKVFITTMTPYLFYDMEESRYQWLDARKTCRLFSFASMTFSDFCGGAAAVAIVYVMYYYTDIIFSRHLGLLSIGIKYQRVTNMKNTIFDISNMSPRENSNSNTDSTTKKRKWIWDEMKIERTNVWNKKKYY